MIVKNNILCINIIYMIISNIENYDIVLYPFNIINTNSAYFSNIYLLNNTGESNI